MNENHNSSLNIKSDTECANFIWLIYVFFYISTFQDWDQNVPVFANIMSSPQTVSLCQESSGMHTSPQLTLQDLR